MNTNQKKYKLIYKSTVSHTGTFEANFLCSNLLELHKDIEKYKSQCMIYDDQLIEIKEVA